MSSFEAEREGIGEGWLPLVDQTHQRLLALDPDYEVAQIKEKLGGLRYYFDPATDDPDARAKMFALVDAAEARSFEICEACGAPGEASSSTGWIKTLCPVHRAELEARRATPRA